MTLLDVLRPYREAIHVRTGFAWRICQVVEAMGTTRRLMAG